MDRYGFMEKVLPSMSGISTSCNLGMDWLPCRTHPPKVISYPGKIWMALVLVSVQTEHTPQMVWIWLAHYIQLKVSAMKLYEGIRRVRASALAMSLSLISRTHALTSHWLGMWSAQYLWKSPSIPVLMLYEWPQLELTSGPTEHLPKCGGRPLPIILKNSYTSSMDGWWMDKYWVIRL